MESKDKEDISSFVKHRQEQEEEQVRLWEQGRAPWYDPNTAGPVQPFIVGVAGGSASGKSTVCHDIVTRLATRWVQTLSTDSFYRPLNPDERKLANTDQYNFDHPNAFDWDLLETILKKIRTGQRVYIPVYDFVTHSRTQDTQVLYGADVVIVEGILALYEERVRKLCDMLIFVDTDSDIRLCRRIRRDIKERGRSVESVLNQYEKTVKPAFDEFIAPTKRYADIIIPRGGGNDVAVSLMVEHIRSQLENRWKLFQKHAVQRDNLGDVIPTPVVNTLTDSPRLRCLMTTIRCGGNISLVSQAADSLCSKLIACALRFVPYVAKKSKSGVQFERRLEICGVSIVRSGEPLMNALRQQCSEHMDLPVGKLVIQQSAQKLEGPRLFYYKFPKNIKDKFVILTVGILASANAVTMALRVLLDHECEEDRLVVVCIAAAAEGVSMLNRLFPKVRVIASCLEDGLDDNMFLIPGLGNFSSRYYGSVLATRKL